MFGSTGDDALADTEFVPAPDVAVAVTLGVEMLTVLTDSFVSFSGQKRIARIAITSTMITITGQLALVKDQMDDACAVAWTLFVAGAAGGVVAAGVFAAADGVVAGGVCATCEGATVDAPATVPADGVAAAIGDRFSSCAICVAMVSRVPLMPPSVAAIAAVWVESMLGFAFTVAASWRSDPASCESTPLKYAASAGESPDAAGADGCAMAGEPAVNWSSL